MIRRKKFLLGVALGLLLLWPAVHVVVVRALDLDPRAFGGLATYAMPPRHQWVLLIELRGDKEVHMHQSWFSKETRLVFRDYEKRRLALGKLAPPHELAEAILAERPEIQALKIIVLQDEISASTARSVARPGTAFIYRR